MTERSSEYVAGFEACRDAALTVVIERECEEHCCQHTLEDVALDIAALPAQAGESVTAHVLARIIEPGASTYNREFKHALELADELLSTFHITGKSEARS